MRGKFGLWLALLLIAALLMALLVVWNMKSIEKSASLTAETLQGDDPVQQAQNVVDLVNGRLDQYSQ